MDENAAISETRPGEKPLLDLVLYPHRSLSPHGFVVLMGVIAALSFTIGLIFFLAGAWPIVGFLGLDVAVIYLAFQLNYRAARAYETIRLSGTELEVVKIDARGRRKRFVLPSAWLRVDLEERPRRASRLTLWSRGRGLEIGAFLGQDEKDGLAEALRDGLRRAALPPHLTIPESN